MVRTCGDWSNVMSTYFFHDALRISMSNREHIKVHVSPPEDAYVTVQFQGTLTVTQT